MQTALLWAASGTGFTFLMTTLGAASVFLFRKRNSMAIQRAFLGFAAGVMIAASVWSLLIPAIERAEEAAARVGGTPAMLDELGERLAQADLVVACAGGEDVLIARDALARAVEARGADASPIVVVDVGLPRTVDPACADVAGAVCFDLDDLDAAIFLDRDLDVVGVAGQGLVYGVVDDLVHQVVQAAFAGGSDVHARALADGFQALEDGDVRCAVGLLAFGGLLVVSHVAPLAVRENRCLTL